MKKVVFVLIVLIAFNVQAQRERSHTDHKLTPEQMAVLRTKQMTLKLELNDAQQKSLLALNKKNIGMFKKMKGERKELTADQRFEMKVQMLDNKIAIQREMKNILNEEQYGKWKKSHNMRSKKMKEKKMKMHKERVRKHRSN